MTNENEAASSSSEFPLITAIKVEKECTSEQLEVQALVHTAVCVGVPGTKEFTVCSLPSCIRVRSMIDHYKSCQSKQKKSCNECEKLHSLALQHSKECTTADCPVLFCSIMKAKRDAKSATAKFFVGSPPSDSGFASSAPDAPPTPSTSSCGSPEQNSPQVFIPKPKEVGTSQKKKKNQPVAVPIKQQENVADIPLPPTPNSVVVASSKMSQVKKQKKYQTSDKTNKSAAPLKKSDHKNSKPSSSSQDSKESYTAQPREKVQRTPKSVSINFSTAAIVMEDKIPGAMDLTPPLDTSEDSLSLPVLDLTNSSPDKRKRSISNETEVEELRQRKSKPPVCSDDDILIIKEVKRPYSHDSADTESLVSNSSGGKQAKSMKKKRLTRSTSRKSTFKVNLNTLNLSFFRFINQLVYLQKEKKSCGIETKIDYYVRTPSSSDTDGN